MTIPINDWYTLKSGDTLSKIAKEACVSDWKIIYNDSNNDAFRKKRPDPNLIYPGDKIWIPGTLKTTTGKKTVFVAPVTAEKIQVTEVYFHSQVEIHYVRLISSHVDYKATGIPIVPGYLHLNPPTIYSQAGKAHWSLDVTTSMPSESWPVVLIRDGANSAGTAVRGLKVSFSALTSFDGDRIIKAETSSGDLIVGEQTVNFQQGKVTKASFKFTKVPNVVKKLSSVTLKWYSKKSASGTFTEICQTQHTIFVIDEKPEKANLRRADMNLFEVIDWSCSWADGASGKESVIDAIWKEFNPVKSSHSTGFEYWKNWNHPVTKIQPHQTIDFAIKGMDDTNPLSKNAVSCAVFDNT